MTVTKKMDGSSLTVLLQGRLDTVTAPDLENALKEDIGGVTELNFDFAELDYVSSAGLRVLLSTQKIMNKQGKMVLRNVKPEIMEVFEITGFVDILTIE